MSDPTPYLDLTAGSTPTGKVSFPTVQVLADEVNAKLRKNSTK